MSDADFVMSEEIGMRQRRAIAEHDGRPHAMPRHRPPNRPGRHSSHGPDAASAHAPLLRPTDINHAMPRSSNAPPGASR